MLSQSIIVPFIYRHVSGAGEGEPLQTTADFSPKAAEHIVNPQTPDDLNQDEFPVPVEQQQDQQPEQEDEKEAKNNVLEPDWQKKIRNLQDQVRTLANSKKFLQCFFFFKIFRYFYD